MAPDPYRNWKARKRDTDFEQQPGRTGQMGENFSQPCKSLFWAHCIQHFLNILFTDLIYSKTQLISLRCGGCEQRQEEKDKHGCTRWHSIAISCTVFSNHHFVNFHHREVHIDWCVWPDALPTTVSGSQSGWTIYIIYNACIFTSKSGQHKDQVDRLALLPHGGLEEVHGAVHQLHDINHVSIVVALFEGVHLDVLPPEATFLCMHCSTMFRKVWVMSDSVISMLHMPCSEPSRLFLWVNEPLS